MKRRFLLVPLLLCALAASLPAAEYRTPNFTVTAADPELARQVGDQAEACREKHAREWLGRTLPKWSAPCPVTVRAGNIGNGGTTSFQFERGEVFGWSMIVQGTPDKIVETVIPHEVLHTILACHFRRGLPRWADEGAATYEEEPAEKRRQKALAAQVVGTREQFPIRQLLSLQDYPENPRAVLVLYAQGFYLAEYLIDQKGKPEFIRFLETYFKTANWDTAFNTHYGFADAGAAYTAAWEANRPPTPSDSTPVVYDTWHIDYFYQSNCGPCRDFKAKDLPTLVDVKNVKVRMINLDEDHNWERARQDGISGTPAFIIYKNEHRQAVIQGYRTAAQLLARCQGLPAVQTAQARQARQGVGIGYFGPVGAQRSERLKNPHTDLNPAQLQIIQREIDARADVKINQAIAANMDNLKSFVNAEIAATALKIREELTPEQKAFINATAEQKAKLDALAEKVQQVETGKSEFQKNTAAQVAALQKADEELDQKAQEANEKAAAIEQTVTGNVLDKIKDKLPSGPVGWVSFLYGAIQAFMIGGPVSAAMFLGSRVIASRKGEEPTPATK